MLPISSLMWKGPVRNVKKRRGGDRYRRVRGDSGQQRRIFAVMAVLGIAAFVPVCIRLHSLMVRSYDTYAALALRNQSRTTRITPTRGVIYDRNFNILADNETVENVYLDPRELQQTGADLREVSTALGQILGKPPEIIGQKAGDRSLRYHLIADRVEEETAERVRAYLISSGVRGVHLEPNTRRSYPYGPLAAQVIGFTNASNEGAEGIEASYDSFLSGAPSRVVTTKGNNEMDMPYSLERFLQGKRGADVVTTLDMTVQACLHNRMEQAVQRYRVRNGAFGIVMDVTTGEILAMETLGSYDPNSYLDIRDEAARDRLEELKQAYLSRPEGSEAFLEGRQQYRDALVAARLKQWRNRCISDGYEPGSTFKTITLAAALDCGAVDLDTRFSCSGAEQIPGRSQLLHCWRHQGHGSQTTAQALQNSCNLAFAHIGLKLGGERFYDYVTRFGIREKTGVDLAGESAGVFFSKELLTDTDRWGTASLTSASFGQTFKLTPIQLVRAIAAVVNGGKLMQPYLVSEITDEDGRVLLRQEPTVVRQVIREETSARMCSLIESVVAEGTAKNATVSGYRVGGKTGTSEKIDVFDENGHRVRDKIVSFAGIAPMDNPRYIILVALDTPSPDCGVYLSGGAMAAPTVGAVLGDILPYLEVSRVYDPEDPAGKAFRVPQMTGLSAAEAEKRLAEQFLLPVCVGEGERVTGQLPLPGEQVPGGTQVLLWFGDVPRQQTVTVPDFSGMNLQQASQAAARLGLRLIPSGNPDLTLALQAAGQSPAAGACAERGSAVQIQFTDPNARD